MNLGWLAFVHGPLASTQLANSRRLQKLECFPQLDDVDLEITGLTAM